MEKSRISESNPEKFRSLSHALGVLNEAADDSAQEIRRMVNTDYYKLKSVLSEVKPSIKNAFGEIKEVATDSVIQTKEAAHKVDESVHQHPWMYLGGVALTSVLAGFLMGRKAKD